MSKENKKALSSFDASLVGKSRHGFRLPICNKKAEHATEHSASTEPPDSLTLSSHHYQQGDAKEKAIARGRTHAVDLVIVPQPRFPSHDAHPPRPPSRPLSESSRGSVSYSDGVPQPNFIQSPNPPSSFYTVDLSSAAPSGAPSSAPSIENKASTQYLAPSFYSEFVRMAYILGFCDIMLMTGSLTSLGGRLAINLSILSAIPILTTAMLVHCFIREKRRMILIPFCAMTLLGYGCVYNIIGESPIPIVAHIPGILLMCIFFSAICNGTRRIVNLLLTMLVCICIAGNAVFSLTEDRNFMIISISCIFGLLFVQSCIGNVFCGASCSSVCADILRKVDQDV